MTTHDRAVSQTECTSVDNLASRKIEQINPRCCTQEIDKGLEREEQAVSAQAASIVSSIQCLQNQV
jgi:hypothetical protein